MTGKSQVEEFPVASMAVQWTIVVPGGKKLPEGGTQTRLVDGSLSSHTRTVNCTVSPGGEPSWSMTDTEAGQWIAGGVESVPLLRGPGTSSPGYHHSSSRSAMVNSPSQ